ncbi:MAG: Fe-S cluster assembly protein SufD [bacterium]|nr:Fe-S cluster assembly protein SufD [bacterium]
MTDVIQASEKSHYLADLQLSGETQASDWLHGIRQSATENFHTLEFPHRRMDGWRLTNVSPLVRTAFRSRLQPELHAVDPEALAGTLFGLEDWTELVFVDGFYSPELSRTSANSGVHAGSLAEAVSSDNPVAREHLDKYIHGNGNVFSALNTAFLLDGAFVHVPRSKMASGPIHLVLVTTKPDEPTAVYPRNLIVVDEQAEATVVESYVGLDGTEDGDAVRFTDSVTEIVVGAGARLTRVKLVHEADTGYHIATTKVHQERDSSLQSFAMTLSGAIVRNGLSVHLGGEGAQCALKGLYLTQGSHLVDNALVVDHAVPHCSSWLGYKGILDDQSHGVFSGNVMVRRDAQKTDSNQLNNNLLLSDKATVDTKPLLEIFADDVKCTHGATVGQPPEEVVFYFRTRGIDESTALAMLTYGFADEVVEEIGLAPVCDRLRKFVFERYSPKRGVS